MKKPKKHFYIILNGEYIGESWAVSAKKAINNFWWRSIKQGDVYASREYDPAEFDAVEG